jgi:DNA-binding winged helix-turn-helix (wHTH) protein
VIYEFRGFQLDLSQRVLVRNGQPVPLTPKVFDTLALLVQNSGRILKKEELMTTLWPESFVEEGNLTQNIFILRKALGDDRNGHGFIETVPRQGYRFVAALNEAETLASKNGLLADYWSRHSPFRSLQIFDTEDAWLFFGRDSEIQHLLDRLGRSPVLTVLGNSGSGKSSLLRAGLIPALRAGRFCHNGSPVVSWRVAVFRPSASPFDYLAETLSNQLAPEMDVKERAEFSAGCRDSFPCGGNTLGDAIRVLATPAGHQTGESGETRVLLVADQFEEIFTLTTKQETRQKYIDALLAAALPGNDAPVHLVLSLRADFYGHCLDHPGLSRSLETNLYNVPRMSSDMLLETIEKRLQLAVARAEPGLIDSLLEDVGNEPGNLALLEHALGQLWDKCGGYGCTLTNLAYSEIGRLRGALGRHADEVYAGLGDERQKRLARKMFLELVQLGEGENVQDTRRRVLKAGLLALGAADEVEALLGRLASSRLISIGREGNEVFVEVSHEALIREWPALREWLAENREDLRLERRLQQAAEEWSDLNRDAGALLQGARLAQAEEWMARSQSLPSMLRDFLEASIGARNQAERKALAAQSKAIARQRWLVSGLAALLLVAFGLAWFAYRQQLIQQSRAMAAQSGELLSRDHGQALNLALRSWRVAKTEEARFAVAKTFPEPLGIFKQEGAVLVTRFSPDGQRIISAGDDHTVRLLNADSGELLVTLQGHTDKIEDAVFSSDCRRIVTASYDHTARVWDRDGRLLVILRGHTNAVERARFSPDGRLIVTASLDHTARVWNSVDGRLLFTLPHNGEVLHAEFSRDGKRIVTAAWDRKGTHLEQHRRPLAGNTYRPHG